MLDVNYVSPYRGCMAGQEMVDQSRTVVAVAIAPDRLASVATDGALAFLRDSYETRFAKVPLDDTSLANLLEGADVALTSWGTPQLRLANLTGDSRVRIVAHAAGSVRRLFPDPSPVLAGKVAVFTAADRIAVSVGEYCLGAALSLLRAFGTYGTMLRSGRWTSGVPVGRELTGRSVGLLGASRTARHFASLLKPFATRLVVYDPYIDEADARVMGGRKGTLTEALSCEVVSLHLPAVPETTGLVTRAHIEAMADGTVVINSARSDVVDHQALMAASEAGRLHVAVDVFPEEPVPGADRIPADVLATPHIAGMTTDGRRALLGSVMADVGRYLADATSTRGRVMPKAWDRVA